MPLRFSNKKSCRGSGSRDSENGASSIFEKAILLGCALPRSTEVDTHWDFLVIKQWCCSFTLVGNNRVAGPSKFMCLNFVRDLWQSYQWYPRS
ncbi:hypothetical protein COP2_039395 [Malus domestica]